jgi:hypothetical protein
MSVEDGDLGPGGFQLYPVSEFFIDPATQPVAEVSEEGAVLVLRGGSIRIGHTFRPAAGLVISFAEDRERASGYDPLIFRGDAQQTVVNLEGVVEGHMIADQLYQLEGVIYMGAEQSLLSNGDC